jgi:hypothetical protein
VSGALRVEEDNSFISKLITLPEMIELEDFVVTTLTGAQDLDNVNLDNIEIVIKESERFSEGYINVNNVLLRYLIEDGITQKFSDFLISSNTYIGNYLTIQLYARDYIKQNILKLYKLSDNEIYSRLFAGVDATLFNIPAGATSVNTIAFEFLNDVDRFKKGYALNRGLQINNTRKLILRFRFNKSPGASLIISPKIIVKLI